MERDSGFHDDLLQSYSDTELVRRIIGSRPLASAPGISLLSSNFLAKYYKADEVEDMINVTDIAAPTAKRIIRNGRHAYCVMDRIPGGTLEDLWTHLSWFDTIKLGFQLRRFVQQIRSITSPVAGSLATGECRSFWLEDRYGLPARCRPGDMEYFFGFWINFTSMRKAIQTADQREIPTPERQMLPTEPFIFTHHDLAPRNILLSPSGELWLLDWDLAGFYPIYFEYAAMQNFHMPQQWGFFARLRWHLFSWIGAGYYRREAHILKHIRSKFTRFAVGRRFHLLKNGGPCRYPAS
jgi:serine/threonine protein kinase